MLLEKRKEKYNIAVLFFCAIIFLVGFSVPSPVFAWEWTDVLSGAVNFIGSPFLAAINLFLYAILTALGWMLSVAVSTLEWAVNPVSVKAMFELPVIYTLWQMIRDFFNLFFILTLLFIAFATIFQIDSFNYKKTLGKLLLMALLVNFSFPISRFIIDTANVPMYFFMESMFTDQSDKSAKNIVEVSLSASQIKSILLPEFTAKQHLFEGSTITMNLIIAIVFSFIFFSSLLSLSIAFAIRNVVLLILVIFSAVGFAGMVIPGFRRMASMWWDKLLKNAFFGPAAMLMLLISVKVMENLNAGGAGSIKDQINANTQSLGAGDLSRAAAAGSIVIIPIILIWLAMGVGQYIGAEGAGMARNWAMKTSLFVTGAAAMRRRYDSFRGEMKKRSDAKYNATNIGTRFGQKAGLKMDEMSAKRVGTRFESRGARHDASAAEESQKRQIAAEAANHRINDRTSQSELKKQADEAYAAKDRAWLMAVQNQQSKKPETAEDIKDEHKDFLNENYKDIGEVKNAARKENDDALAAHRADLVYRSETDREDALKKGKIKLDQQSSKSLNTLAAAAVKTGKVNQEMLETMKKEDPAKAASFITAVDAGIKAMEKEYARVESRGGTLTEEQQKARATSHQAYYHATGSMHGTVMGNNAHHAAVRGRVFKKANPTTLKANLKNPATRDADVENIVRSTPTGQIVSTTATLVDEDEAAARAFVANIRSQQTHSDPTIRANADSAMKMLANDRRTQHLI